MTGMQSFSKCCGYFCGLSACIGIYFFLVIMIMQAGNNVYLAEML